MNSDRWTKLWINCDRQLAISSECMRLPRLEAPESRVQIEQEEQAIAARIPPSPCVSSPLESVPDQVSACV